MGDADYTTEEGVLTAQDGHELYTKTWKPTSPVKARMAFIHGFSDHSNFYGVLFPTIAKYGIEVYSFDQRGWGQSVKTPAQKGLTGPTSLVIDDITTFTKTIPCAADDGIPLFVMGHSMGGAETLVWAATAPESATRRIRGFLAESPFVALHPASKPFKLTVILGRLAGRLLPHVHMVQKLDPGKLARDPEIGKKFESDPLCHNTGTLEGLAGMLDRAGDLEGGKIVLNSDRCEGGKTRILVAHGTGDEICDFNAAKDWYNNCIKDGSDKELKVYDGWYHKLHDEPGDDKYQFSEYCKDWILKRSGSLAEVDGTDRAKL
ncbi:serine hydrolase-like protein [Polychaeton citri CBS 116435]|uniref:Serine hydrolase-like protein n=1 Tax=Polychaeton citri CBS 116435 TaxID=1314669 RepID=A0A9P4Q9U9_9PEZI|nr:serine hydrolase-like protein [Polychaeton citri CBS 116435]